MLKVENLQAALERATHWQPIETAPKDGSFILLHVPNGAVETGPVTIGTYFRIEDRDEKGRFRKGSWFPADWTGWMATDGDCGPSWCDPTHWMPLPEPPR